jgi:preprotein translocase subunit SecE
VAKETRRQRRDARRAAGDDGVSASGGGQAAVEAAPPQQRAQRGGFIRESWAELQKVDWPNRSQVIQGTVVVIIACAVVGLYLWGVDQVLRPFVRDILLGQ